MSQIEPRPCQQCGEPIPQVYPSGRPVATTRYACRLYCSWACLHASQTLALAPRPCARCGQPIPRSQPNGRRLSSSTYRQRLYCSNGCRLAAEPALTQRPDQWERCANGHSLDASTRVVRPNGRVDCRLCQRSAALACHYRRKQRQYEQERAAGWIRLADAEREYGLTRHILMTAVRDGDVEAYRPGHFWLLREADLTPYTIQRGEITLKEATRVLGVTRQRVHQLVKTGALRARRVGRSVLLDGASVAARWAQQRQLQSMSRVSDHCNEKTSEPVAVHESR